MYYPDQWIQLILLRDILNCTNLAVFLCGWVKEARDDFKCQGARLSFFSLLANRWFTPNV